MKKLKPVTPGEILEEEFLKPLNISMTKLAKLISVPPGRITQIIKGNREITTDTALRLSLFFGNTPEFWLNLQRDYNLKSYQNRWEEIKKIIDTNKIEIISINKTHNKKY